MCSQILLSMTAPQLLEDEIVDWLIQLPETPEFSAIPVYEHIKSPLCDTVDGFMKTRRRKIRFDIVMDEGLVSGVLSDFKEWFDDSEIVFRVSPILTYGRISA